MKPTIYFVALLCFVLLQFPMYGQRPSLGVTAGINISNIDFESTDQYLGYYGGVRMQYPIKGKFSMVSSLLYSRKGFDFGPFPPTMHPGGSMHLDYVDLQASCQYAITKSFAAEAGFEVGRLLKATRSPYKDNVDLYQKGDFSLLMGLNYTIWKSIRLEAKYLHGLSHLYEGYTTDINGNYQGIAKVGNFSIFQLGLSTDLIIFQKEEKAKG